MVSRIKTNALLLVLLAGIVAPACAMDADQNSNGFPWKSATGTALVVGAALVWYLWPSTKSEAKAQAITKQVEQDQPVQESDLIARFKRLHLTGQKVEIARLCDAYVQSQTDETMDTMTQFAQVYCERVKSEDLIRAIDRLFAAKNQRARQDECINIKQVLGLVYH